MATWIDLSEPCNSKAHSLENTKPRLRQKLVQMFNVPKETVANMSTTAMCRLLRKHFLRWQARNKTLIYNYFVAADFVAGENKENNNNNKDVERFSKTKLPGINLSPAEIHNMQTRQKIKNARLVQVLFPIPVMIFISSKLNEFPYHLTRRDVFDVSSNQKAQAAFDAQLVEFVTFFDEKEEDDEEAEEKYCWVKIQVLICGVILGSDSLMPLMDTFKDKLNNSECDTENLQQAVTLALSFRKYKTVDTDEDEEADETTNDLHKEGAPKKKKKNLKVMHTDDEDEDEEAEEDEVQKQTEPEEDEEEDENDDEGDEGEFEEEEEEGGY